MKLLSAAALALLAIAPTVASANVFSIDFEKNWPYGTQVRNYYNGGVAEDGTSGTNQGVQFVNVSGLSNDPDFTYFTNAPSPLGTAYASTSSSADRAFLNVAGGVSNALSFFYSTPSAITGAIRAYSGVNGTGDLLVGTINLAANIDGSNGYDVWSLATFTFAGVARSFDLTATANLAGLDNIKTVPEPGTVLMMLMGATALVGMRGRRNRG